MYNVYVHISEPGPISDIYGIPVEQALKLICTLCQSGRNITAILVSA